MREIYTQLNYQHRKMDLIYEELYKRNVVWSKIYERN